MADPVTHTLVWKEAAEGARYEGEWLLLSATGGSIPDSRVDSPLFHRLAFLPSSFQSPAGFPIH